MDCCKESSGSFLIKQTYTAATFEQFSEKLKEHETTTSSKFIFVNSTKKFLDGKVEFSTTNLRIHWQEDIPYLNLGSTIYACHQGKDYNTYNKKKYAANRASAVTKRYNKVKTTKKVDCPAKIIATRVLRFMNHKLAGGTTKKKKDACSVAIKSAIANGTDLGEECYIFNLPTEDEHKYHLKGQHAEVIEPVNKQVRKLISDLVVKGERNAQVIAKLIYAFAENDLNECDRSNRKFFPDMKTIRKIISATKLQVKNSPIDQKNCAILLEKFQQDKTNNIYFRPHAFPDDQEETCTGPNLLFVYQNNNMKRLYRRYGTNSVLLDATHHTCKYALPLYFIVVETNVNFQIVGVIITQFETKESICEGLNIFRSFNPDILPKYGMVDFAMEEILSLEQVFPNMEVYICPFHREQAWDRWISKSKNSSIPRKEALVMLRKIANASTELEMDEALTCLKEWEHYETTPLKVYFEGTWLPELKRWALALKPLDIFINSNDSVERLNKELKYGFLQAYKGSSLSKILNVIITQFLPERYRAYIRENNMSSKSKRYADDIPKYLHKRPKWFISHVMTKLDAAECLGDGVSILPLSNTLFLVKSEDTSYIVDFDTEACISTCNCPDFRKGSLICEHMVLIGLRYPQWHLKSNHEWMFENPIFSCDLGVDVTLGRGNENDNEIASTIQTKYL